MQQGWHGGCVYLRDRWPWRDSVVAIRAEEIGSESVAGRRMRPGIILEWE
jgi:hypothetical protein